MISLYFSVVLNTVHFTVLIRCGPSRAAIMTGRTNVYNANVSQKISTFDDDIGYVAGLPIGTQTIANAFKQYGSSIGVNYTAHYLGKWGIGVRIYMY